MENNDIKKALEICAEDTPYPDQSRALLDALALINSQEQKIEHLKQYIEKADNGIFELQEKIKELTEENERLRAKQTPQKPLNTRREIICPSCRTLVGSRPYCGYCGQAIDWSKESEGE